MFKGVRSCEVTSGRPRRHSQMRGNCPETGRGDRPKPVTNAYHPAQEVLDDIRDVQVGGRPGDPRHSPTQ